MKNQLKAGIILSYIVNGISIIIEIVYMPIMIRLLGQSEYGLYTLVSGVVSYLSLFSLGFTGSYLRFFSRFNQKKDREGLASLNGMFFLIFLILAFVALICGLTLSFFPKQIFGSKLSGVELSEARVLMIILVINIAISLISSIFDSIVSAYEQFIFQRIVSLLAVIINPFVCLPLLLMGYGNIMIVVVSLGITIGKLCMNLWFCVRKLKIPISFHNFRISLVKEMAFFSFFLLLNMIIDQINWNVDKLILSHTNGIKEVAIYGVASQINKLFITFSVTISSVFSPRINRIAADYDADYQQQYTVLMAKIGRIQWLILGLLSMGFIIFGKIFIVNIYAGNGYEKAYTVSLYLVIPALISLIQNIGIEIQRALNMHQFRSIIYIVMAVFNVFISIPLAERFGAVGTAMGTAISLIVANGFIMNVFYHKVLKINMIFFWKEIGKTLTGFLIPVIVGALIMRYISFTHLVTYILCIVMFLVIYGLSIYCFSCNEKERDLVLSLIVRKRNEK
ncbi:MAG: oligosaccharide flippase family protein [Frisingicoccus sp.]|uniref:lipopolysaccharide biosynthesis protein n=1 Tax=Frisingicoccus sp. TaxID=1918627 RepID=UPI0026242B27|nr:oligosaccharide flippase family protein [Frisingicoccus sp.]MDD6233550.1 oligosaccharide flippase family protein [Frisingicoccus sp.]